MYHSGNITYREIVKSRSKEYVSDTEGEKKDGITQEIIDCVRRKGGRFLQLTRDEQHWEICSEKVVRIRVKQALRDYAKERSRSSCSSKPTKKPKLSRSRAQLQPVSCTSPNNLETLAVGNNGSHVTQPINAEQLERALPFPSPDEHQPGHMRTATGTSRSSISNMTSYAGLDLNIPIPSCLNVSSTFRSAGMGHQPSSLSPSHSLLPPASIGTNHRTILPSISPINGIAISSFQQHLFLLEVQRQSLRSQLRQAVLRSSTIELLRCQREQLSPLHHSLRNRNTTTKVRTTTARSDRSSLAASPLK